MFVVPGAVDALQALAACPKGRGVPPHTLELVHLRASKINGCSVCVDLHSRNLKKAGETDEQLAAAAARRAGRPTGSTAAAGGRGRRFRHRKPAWQAAPLIAEPGPHRESAQMEG